MSWVYEQIAKDREDKYQLINDVFEMLQPWLNQNLYVAIKKREKQEEEKVTRIAKTKSSKDVEVLNLYDTMMKNAGIDPDKLKE